MNPERRPISSPKVLLACYGGGHVAMVLPVARHMLTRGWQPVVLGLTTASHKVKESGVPRITMAELLSRFGDERALAHGKRLAGSVSHSLVPYDESVAYLGLGYADLEERLGTSEAIKVYAEQGRTAFLPTKLMCQWIEFEKPDLIVATTSPRTERALLQAARISKLPAVAIVDFHRPPAPWLMGADGLADRLCVLAKDSREFFVDSGRAPEDIVITGNPAFDSLAFPETIEASRVWQTRQQWPKNEFRILWASQVEPETHPTTGEAGDKSLPMRVEAALIEMLDRHSNWRLIARPHPSEGRSLGALPTQAQWSTQEDPLHAVLHAIDVVVTFTSTVGLEAALIDKPVVTVDLSVLTSEFPMSQLGISRGVRDMQALEQALIDAEQGCHPKRASIAPAGGATERCQAVLEGLLNKPVPCEASLIEHMK